MDRTFFYSAAGGVVYCDEKVLLLDRPTRKEVRLPKGHIEEEESPREAALREVCEETGYCSLMILADLGQQHVEFIDPYSQRHVHRDEQYYLMVLGENCRGARSEQELQFFPRWATLEEALAQLTFASEREAVHRAVRWLEQRTH